MKPKENAREAKPQSPTMKPEPHSFKALLMLEKLTWLHTGEEEESKRGKVSSELPAKSLCVPWWRQVESKGKAGLRARRNGDRIGA